MYTIAPEDSTHWKCPWIDCFAGMSLAGSGKCMAKGDWSDPDCPEYIKEDEFLRKWKEEDGKRL